MGATKQSRLTELMPDGGTTGDGYYTTCLLFVHLKFSKTKLQRKRKRKKYLAATSRTTKITKTDNTLGWRGCRTGSSYAGRNVNWNQYFRNNIVFLPKLT